MNQYQKEIERLLALQDKRTSRKVYDLYRETVRELKKSLEADYQNFEKLSRTEKINLNRAEALLESLESRLVGLQEGLNGLIPDHLKASGKLAYNGLFYEYEQTRSAIAFSMLREDELMTLIETPVAGFRLSERITDGLVPDLRKNIKDELTRGFLYGDNYARVSKRLALVGQSSFQRAMRIVRTETGRVTATTRQRSQSEADQLGIELEKLWVATLDKRTRHNHGQLDGQRVAPNDYFEVNGRKALQPHMFGVASEDINCRCRTISVLKGDDTPLLRRDNETGEVVRYKNYREWEKARGYEVKKSKSLEKADDKVYNQGMSNLDFMAKQRSFTVGNDIRVSAKKISGTDFDFWAQDNTKKIRDTQSNIQEVFQSLTAYNKPTVVFLKKSRLPGFAGYDYKQDILFVSDMLHSESEFSEILSDNFFAAKNIKDTIIHELTHKKHWDSAKAFYKANKKRYNSVEEAMSALNAPLMSYVKEQIKQDYNYLYRISDNAAVAFYRGNINELVAEVGVLGDGVQDKELYKKVQEVLSWK